MANMPAAKPFAGGSKSIGSAPQRTYANQAQGYVAPPTAGGVPAYSGYGGFPVGYGGGGSAFAGGVPQMQTPMPGGFQQPSAPPPQKPPQQPQQPGGQGGGGQPGGGQQGSGQYGTKQGALGENGQQPPGTEGYTWSDSNGDGVPDWKWSQAHGLEQTTPEDRAAWAAFAGGNQIQASATATAAPMADSAALASAYDAYMAKDPYAALMGEIRGSLGQGAPDADLYRQALRQSLIGLDRSQAADQMRLDEAYANAGLSGSGFFAEDLTGMGQKYAEQKASQQLQSDMAYQDAVRQWNQWQTQQLFGLGGLQQASQEYADAPSTSAANFSNAAWNSYNNLYSQLDPSATATGQFATQATTKIGQLQAEVAAGLKSEAQATAEWTAFLGQYTGEMFA